MSEQEGQSGAQGGANDNSQVPRETGGPTARLRRTPWRGWIWSVPLAAMILVGYLVVRTWVFEGPVVTVTFPTAEGVGPDGTPVKYKGVQVGRVTAVKLSDNAQQVTLTMSMNGDADKLLRTRTRFWIVKPNILSGNVSNLISGSYVEMRPGKGKKNYHFKGLLHAPMDEPSSPGTKVALYAPRTWNIQKGASVLYHGLKAGKVLGVSYEPSHESVRLNVFIRKPFDKLMGPRVRFWQTGGFGLSTAGGGAQIHMPSLQTLLQGGISFADIGNNASGDRVAGGYQLYASEDAAREALAGPSTLFAVTFRSEAANLAVGSPVDLDGVRVGEVRSVSLKYDAKTQRMIMSVTIALYARPFGLPAQSGSADDNLKHVVEQLVNSGLRAQVGQSIPLVGGGKVSLVMAGKPGTARVDTAVSPARLPAIRGSGIAGLIASLNKVPVGQIGQHIDELSKTLQQLAASPKIRQSIDHLDAALANVQRVTSRHGEIQPTLESLRHAANATTLLAKTINQVTGGSIDQQVDLEDLIGELTRTARSIRVLADYLQRHPEALIEGRKAQ